MRLIPMTRPRRPGSSPSVSPNTSTRQISPQSSGSHLKPDHPGREHRRPGEHGSALHLHAPIVGRETPKRRLCLADDETLPKRLLAARTARRAGPVARLDRGDPQRFLVKLRTPQRLLGWIVSPQAFGDDFVRRCCLLRPRTPRRQVGWHPHRLIQPTTGEALLDGRRPEHASTLRALRRAGSAHRSPSLQHRLDRWVQPRASGGVRELFVRPRQTF